MVAFVALLGLSTSSCSKDDSKGGGALRFEVYRGPIYYNQLSKFISLTADGAWSLKVLFEADTEDWASVSPMEGVGSASLAVKLTENTNEEPRDFTIVVTNGGKESKFTVIQLGTADGDGSQEPEPPLPPDITEPNQLTDIPTGWRELPKATAMVDGKPIISHRINLGGKSVRNYTMLFDEQYKLAYWVAYPMHSSYIGTANRSKKFIYDPYMPRADQAYLNGTYKERDPNNSNGNWYDRGHQIPSADRTCTDEANQQTFYYTNMTAQYYKLNQQVWAGLEDKVRAWMAGCDTLYVVTGAVLKTAADNTVAFAHDNDDKEIGAPRAYYKVLMKWKTDGTVEGIGFWFDNYMYGSTTPYPYLTASKTNYLDFAAPISEIERKTGFTFFNSSSTLIKGAFNANVWPGLSK